MSHINKHVVIEQQADELRYEVQVAFESLNNVVDEIMHLTDCEELSFEMDAEVTIIRNLLNKISSFLPNTMED